MESLREHDDDEDPRRAVLWPGFRIVGAKEPVEKGEDKELAVRERTTPNYAQRRDMGGAPADSWDCDNLSRAAQEGLESRPLLRPPGCGRLVP